MSKVKHWVVVSVPDRDDPTHGTYLDAYGPFTREEYNFTAALLKKNVIGTASISWYFGPYHEVRSMITKKSGRVEYGGLRK